jgi:GNAT superfamily N-acetyltransferase
MSTTAETSPANLSLRIRAATLEDAGAVFALVTQLNVGQLNVGQLNVTQLNVAEVPERESFDAAFADAVIGSRDQMLLVAEVDQAVVGYALATIARLLYANGDVAQLQELVVDVASAGNGYGSQLVSAVELECRARGVRQLTVASIRRAATFYERLDYRSTADYLKKVFVAD